MNEKSCVVSKVIFARGGLDDIFYLPPLLVTEKFHFLGSNEGNEHLQPTWPNHAYAGGPGESDSKVQPLKWLVEMGLEAP